jgi:hypothetical protein
VSNVHAAVQRLGSDQRRWRADIAIRGVGALLLGIAAACACWLHRLAHRLPVHTPGLLDFCVAMLVVLGWGCGWAALGEGQGLFRLVELPGRHAPLDLVDKGNPS